MWPSRWRGSQAGSAPADSAAARPPLPAQLLRQLQWPVLRPLAVALGGEERALVRVPGLELTELREYQPGDDVRHIDWNVSARAGHPFVRLSQADRALDVWLVLDTSASLNWGTARCLKRDHARTFAHAAAYLLARRGNRVGALLFAEQPWRTIAPAAGRGHLLRLLALLQETPPLPPQPQRRAHERSHGPTDLAGALRRARLVMPRRSLVLVISDFLAADGWQNELRRLAARHEVVAARIVDPREAELPDLGIVTFEDPETGEQVTIDTSTAGLRERFQRAAAAQAARISAALTSCGVDELVLATDRDVVPALLAFLRQRQARARLAGRTVLSAPRRRSLVP